jgi:GT2 family glycosyltransferase
MTPKAKTKKIKHAVVLINFKNAQDTIVAVDSIKKCQDMPYIIVVDNGSSKECVAELAAAHPDIDLIVSKQNVGFSVGNNIGIKKALRLGAKVVYILNNDTEVKTDLFAKSYKFVAGRNRIAGGKIYYAKGYEFHDTQKGRGDVIWYAGGFMDWSMAIAKHYGVDEIDQGQHDGIRPVDFITGCFIAVPRQVFKTIGMLDEPFFLYLEDSDFCLKAAKYGIEVMYNSDLVVYHRNSSSTVAGSPLVDYYITRNRFFIGRRYGTFRLFFALIREAIFRNWNSPIRRMAFVDFLLGKMGNRNDQIFALTAKK